MEALRAAMTSCGLQSLLRHGDRNSMHWSVESRVPFLTIDLAEFLLSLPEDFLLSSTGETKRIFRTAMRGIAPDTVLDRRDKISFLTPEREWLHMLGSRVYQWLDGAVELPFFNVDACHSELRAVMDGQRPFSYQVWRMINYCRWAQMME